MKILLAMILLMSDQILAINIDRKITFNPKWCENIYHGNKDRFLSRNKLAEIIEKIKNSKSREEFLNCFNAMEEIELIALLKLYREFEEKEIEVCSEKKQI